MKNAAAAETASAVFFAAVLACLAAPSFAAETPAQPPAEGWKGEVALGYSHSSGNTDSRQFDGRVVADYKVEKKDEWNFKADALYGAQEGKMNAKKAYAMGRYAYSFGAEKDWYHFFKQEADHDRFTDIQYRLVPSTGVGYWFVDRPEWKFLAEAGIGVEHTNYRSNRESTTEPVAIPRLYAERTFANKFKASQDLTSYLSLSDWGEYRLRSETILEYPFSDKFTGRLSVIDEYNSDPSPGRQSNDFRLISSLVYKF